MIAIATIDTHDPERGEQVVLSDAELLTHNGPIFG